MMFRNKRMLAFCLVAGMLWLTSCSASAEPSPTPTFAASPMPQTHQVVRLGIIRAVSAKSNYPAEESEEHLRTTEEEINRLLDEAGTGLRLELVIIPPGNAGTDWKNFHDNAIRDRENSLFDIYPSYIGTEEDFEALARDGHALNLAGLLGNFPDLLAMNDERVWQEATVDGGNYWIPLVTDPNGVGITGELIVDQAWLDTLEADFPQTAQEMIELLREGKRRGLPHKLILWQDDFAYTPPYFLHRTYEEWPFYVDANSLFIYYADGAMEPYAESEIFQKDAAFLREMAAEDLLYVHSSPSRSAALMAGAVMGSGESTIFMEDGPVMNILEYANDENIAVERGSLAPEKSGVRVQPFCSSGFFVSPNCADSEAALAMINAIYTNDRIFLALAFGVEGEDWEFREDGTIRRLIDRRELGFRYVFEHHAVMARYLSAEDTTSIRMQDLPFSGFAYRTGSYGVASPLLNEAMRGIVALRNGERPMEEYEDVMRRLRDSDLGVFYKTWQDRYDEFLHKEP